MGPAEPQHPHIRRERAQGWSGAQLRREDGDAVSELAQGRRGVADVGLDPPGAIQVVWADLADVQ